MEATQHLSLRSPDGSPLRTLIAWSLLSLVGVGGVPAEAGGRSGKRVKNTKAIPACFVGRVNCLHKDKKTGKETMTAGTGALIGPRHVLTAAHVMWTRDPGGGGHFPNRAWFIPGMNGETDKPFGVAEVVTMHMQRKFQRARGKMRLDRDIAILLLDRNLAAVTKGHFQVAALSDRYIAHLGPHVQLHGYPALHKSKDLEERAGRRQLTYAGPIRPWTRRVEYSAVSSRYFRADWNLGIPGGASGGPVWATFVGAPTGIGISIRRDRVRGFAEGFLLDRFYVRWIKDYIRKNP